MKDDFKVRIKYDNRALEFFFWLIKKHLVHLVVVMLSGVDQIITSSNSFLNSFDKGAHLMKFGLAPIIDAIFI